MSRERPMVEVRGKIGEPARVDRRANCSGGALTMRAPPDSRLDGGTENCHWLYTGSM